MDLAPYVAALREHLLTAAAPDSAPAEALARRLVLALAPATRLVILDALSRAADELTTEIAPGTVEVRLRGGEPQFVVQLPDQDFERQREPHDPDRGPVPGGAGPTSPGPTGTTGMAGIAGIAGADSATETELSRISLRLPDRLKVRAEAASAERGMSLNAWLTAVVAQALQEQPSPPGRGSDAMAPRSWTGRARPGQQRFTGWAR